MVTGACHLPSRVCVTSDATARLLDTQWHAQVVPATWRDVGTASARYTSPVVTTSLISTPAVCTLRVWQGGSVPAIAVVAIHCAGWWGQWHRRLQRQQRHTPPRMRVCIVAAGPRAGAALHTQWTPVYTRVCGEGVACSVTAQRSSGGRGGQDRICSHSWGGVTAAPQPLCPAVTVRRQSGVRARSVVIWDRRAGVVPGIFSPRSRLPCDGATDGNGTGECGPPPALATAACRVTWERLTDLTNDAPGAS